METAQQEAMMPTKPQKEHQWLQKWIGQWTYETEVTMGADQPPEKATGIETVRSLGELWVLAEGRGEMPGCSETVTTLMTLGYDPQKQRYIGTWISSMMAHLWRYEDGQLDAAETTLTFESEGPAMSGEGMARYRDAIEFKSDHHRVMTSAVLGGDGQWHLFMTVHYKRQS
jgi:hypothetical protein